WPKFDPEVLGGNYHNHHPDGPVATVAAAEGAGAADPLLTGVKLPFASKGALYKTSPVRSSAKVLLLGAIPDQKPEPVAWTNANKKGRVFYTSLGHRDDFANPSFVRLLHNAARWALDMRIPEEQPPAPPWKKGTAGGR